MKTVYEEALQDMKKMREVAEANARNTIIDALTPKLKDLIEKNLSEGVESEELDEADFAAASGVAAHPEMTGATSGEDNGSDSGDEGESDETKTEAFEVKEESYEPLFHLSNLAGPALTDRIIAEVYKTYDCVNEFVTGARQIDSVELDNTIRKIEDIYSYLQEHSVDSKGKLEEKLETCYGLLNSFRESKMKMKELVSEEKNESSDKLDEEKDVTLRITGLPDDVELENLNIDIIADEEPMGDEAGMPGDDMDAGAPPGDESPVPAGPPGMGEGEEEEDILSDDTVVEVSIPMLRKAIAAVKEAKKRGGPDKEVLDNFGGGKSEGDPWLDSDMDRLSETDGESVDEEAEGIAELQNRRKRDEKGADAADKHLSKESVEHMLKLASDDLKESKAWYSKHVGTGKEADARKVVERAAKRFERIKELADKRLGPVAKKMDEAAAKSKAAQSELTESRKENEGLRKQLAEVNLLNSKLIHANKLLQREGLTKNQKVTVIDRLDEAASLREVKLIYESLIKAFADDGQGTIKEGVSRRPKAAGSSSRTTTSADRPVISEGMETARWLELAGLSTK
jgi:hypothetical protein